MKKLLLFITFITMVMNVNAQDNWCGTNSDESSDSFINFSEVNQNVPIESFSGLETYVLKVRFWDLNNDNGSNNSDNDLTELQALNAVAILNKNYNAFNIFFKYDGISEINSTEYQEIDTDPDTGNYKFGFRPFVRDNNLYLEGAVNIYSIGDILPSAVAASEGSGNENFKIIICENGYINDPENSHVLTHEVGHFFNLYHTFHCRTDATGEYVCENVTRDDTDTECFNANIKGDGIIDTNATPKVMTVDGNCLYVPNGEVDHCGVPYNYGGLEPEVKNFMGYNNDCAQEFTAGQVAVMRFVIKAIINESNLNWIVSYPVSILYEPYLGDYAPYYPHSTPWVHPHFQPGFDYDFVECGGEGDYPQPADYSDTSFYYDNNNILLQIDKDETDFSSIVHPNHSAIRILQFTNQQPRKCYDNYNSPPVIGGVVVKFNDNIINTNVTVTPKDSTSINDEELIDDLQPGLYNIIKNFENGDTQESVIYKENN